MNIKSILLIMMLVCLIAAANYEAKAQCPPEYDCEVPPDDEGGGNSECSPWYCGPEVLTDMVVSPYGTILRAKYCADCQQDCWSNAADDYVTIFSRRCWWVNYYASSYDPSKDIEALAFTDLIAVMEDLTRRAQMTTRI